MVLKIDMLFLICFHTYIDKFNGVVAEVEDESSGLIAADFYHRYKVLYTLSHNFIINYYNNIWNEIIS